MLLWKEGTLSAKVYDYRPFGDSLAATGELPNQGFAGQEKDRETECIQLGARTYNPAIGRFMAVDPLFESFPGQSPYSYAFNSPMQWQDPSGLAPEKERKRDRVQSMLLKDISNEIANIDRINYEASWGDVLSSQEFKMNNWYQKMYTQALLQSIGTPTRTGNQWTMNGMTLDQVCEQLFKNWGQLTPGQQSMMQQSILEIGQKKPELLGAMFHNSIQLNLDVSKNSNEIKMIYVNELNTVGKTDKANEVITKWHGLAGLASYINNTLYLASEYISGTVDYTLNCFQYSIDIFHSIEYDLTTALFHELSHFLDRNNNPGKNFDSDIWEYYAIKRTNEFRNAKEIRNQVNVYPSFWSFGGIFDWMLESFDGFIYKY